jgi:hypothetical protein
MKISGRREFFSKLAAFGGLAALAATPAKAQTASKRVIKGEAPEPPATRRRSSPKAARRSGWPG